MLEPGADSYQILSNTGTAVTVFSTIAMEALAFACRSIVLDYPALISEYANRNPPDNL